MHLEFEYSQQARIQNLSNHYRNHPIKDLF